MIMKAYVRRIPLKDWSVQDKDGFASILLHGWQIWWGVLFSWHLSYAFNDLSSEDWSSNDV